MSPYHIIEKETRYSLLNISHTIAGSNLAKHIQAVFEIPILSNNKTAINGLANFSVNSVEELFSEEGVI
jgi:hypothetical protein